MAQPTMDDLLSAGVVLDTNGNSPPLPVVSANSTANAPSTRPVAEEEEERSTAPTVLDDEYDEEDGGGVSSGGIIQQGQQQHHHSLPAVDEILVTHQRRSNNDGDQNINKRRRRSLLLLLLLVILLGVVIAIPIALSSSDSKNGNSSNSISNNNNNNNNNEETNNKDENIKNFVPTLSPVRPGKTFQPIQQTPTLKPTIIATTSNDEKQQRYEQTIAFLIQVVPYPHLLETDGTPQSKAALWISILDSRSMDIPQTSYDADNESQKERFFIERYALATLYYSLNGDDWTKTNYDFLTSYSVCDWYIVGTVGSFPNQQPYIFGCQCDGMNDKLRVVRLVVSDNNMVGSIPPDIGLLTTLWEFSIWNSPSVIGTMPNEIQALTDLQRLQFFFTSITGRAIPSWIGSLTSLISLEFWDNLFTGTIHDNIALLNETIQRIDLEDNIITGDIPTSLGLLTNLESLDLSRNFFNSSIPSETIGQLSNLVYLNLDRNDIIGSIPPTIGLLTNLESIDLAFNRLTGSIPTEIGKLTNLDFLYLQGRNNNDYGVSDLSLGFYDVTIGGGLSNKIPNEIQYLSNLRSLFLSNNVLSGPLPSWLDSSNFPLLNNILLSNNILTGPLPESLRTLSSSLQRLYIDDNELTGSTNVLNSLTNLVSLFIEDNEFEVTGDDFLSSSSSFTQLQILDASDNKLYGNFPKHLLQLQSLNTLDLHGNQFTSLTLPGDGQNTTTISTTAVGKQLEFLSLHDNKFKGTIPTTISNLESLKHLDLSNNLFRGDIPSEIGTLQGLTYLFVANNNKLQSAPIPKFIRSMTNLRELSLKSTQRTSSIPKWIGELTNLILLDLDNNELTNTIPHTVVELRDLKFLLLNRNELVGAVPDEMHQITNLQLLSLDENNITGTAEGLFCNGANFIANTFSALTQLNADCDEFTCQCCTLCCTSGSGDSATCNDDELLAIYDPVWERNYDRTIWEFAPNNQNLTFYAGI